MTTPANATPARRLADEVAQVATSARGWRDLYNDFTVDAETALKEIGADLDRLTAALEEFRAEANAPVQPRPAEAVSDSGDEEE